MSTTLKRSLYKPIVRLIALVGFGVLAYVPMASATFMGDTVLGCTNTVFAAPVTTDPLACAPNAAGFDTSAAIIDPGVEFTVTGGVGARSIDFTGDTVSVIYAQGQASPSADLFVFTDLNWDTPAEITGLELLTDNALNITTAFTADAIGLLVNSPLCCFEMGATVTFRILTSASSVPAPGALALLGIGLIGIATTRKKTIA